MEPKESFGGDYVLAMDQLPVSRFRWLVPRLGLRPTDEIVDYACGSGRLLDCIHDKVRHYCGVDFSSDFIAYATERIARLGITNASFECSEIVEFCSRNHGRFDLATTVDFSPYLDDATFITIYSAIRDSLKAGGRLALYTANGSYLLEILKQHGLAPKPRGAYRKVHTAEEHQRLLTAAGFRRVDIAYTPHFNVLRHLHALSHVPLAGEYFRAKILVLAAA